ncbi:MAG: hypothetical protein KAX36_00660 [Thermoflexales bacterium]|nr:hypothetical protein [Thermoflexales bacterium]
MASVLDYSTTAGSNTTVGGVNIAEGMQAGLMNNALRAAMADSKKWQLDWSGIVTAGTSNAYTITSNQGIAAYADGLRFTFRADRNNTGAATLNVDSRGAKALRKVTGGALAAVAADDIVADAVYDVVYDLSSDVFVIVGFAAPTISAFAQTILDDADAAAVRTTIGAQASDADLTALAGLGSTGIAVRTAADTWAQRQITSADGSVTITNPAGVAGDIDLSVGGGTALASWAYSSNVTSIPLIGLAGWDSVVVTGFLTVSANVQLRVSPDNGSTWRSTNYVWRVLDEGGATDPTDGMDLCRIGSGSIQFDLTLQRMSQAARSTYASGNARHGNPRMNTFAGIHNVSEVINAVQIVGATISAGYVDVYGIRRA